MVWVWKHIEDVKLVDYTHQSLDCHIHRMWMYCAYKVDNDPVLKPCYLLVGRNLWDGMVWEWLVRLKISTSKWSIRPRKHSQLSFCFWCSFFCKASRQEFESLAPRWDKCTHQEVEVRLHVWKSCYIPTMVDIRCHACILYLSVYFHWPLRFDPML